MLKNGHNCSEISQVDRYRILIDGEEYFSKLRSVLLQAQRRICILGWEFHSQTDLLREDVDDDYPTEIGPLLDRLLEEREELEVYLLIWDYALIYLAEREWSIFSEWQRNTHPRLHFVSDKTAPNGASHHQKLATIDDSLAFCGGMDVSISRWDTRQHKLKDDRRINPDGKPHDPYHDIHTAISGDLTRSLQQCFNRRWKNATDEELPLLDESDRQSLWPEEWDPHFSNVDVAISQILASPSESPTEIEQLHLDLIAAAKSHLYIENQYFSSKTICEALIERLREKSGPTITLLLPQSTSGWLVESTVGLLRDHLLDQLKAADSEDRLRFYAPVVKDEDDNETGIYVHAKLIVVDDRILKIGSSNLSNRSMRMDSELDLTLEFDESDDTIRSIRQGLIGQHFGMSEQEWAEKESNARSLQEALDAAVEAAGDHTLVPLPYGCDSDFKKRLAESQALDPEDPVDPEFFIQKNLKEEERPYVWKRLRTTALTLAFVVLIGILLNWNPGGQIGMEQAVAFGESIVNSPWAPLIAFTVFAIGGSLGIPLNLMLVATVLAMGSRFAIAYGIPGAMVSAGIGFYMGHLLGKPLVRKLGSKRVDAVNEKLSERSFRSVAFIRLIPIAPFFLINMVAGASRLKFKEYAIGTVLGMTPGMCAVVLLANRVEATARHPSWETFLTLFAVVAALVLVVGYFRKTLSARSS